MRVIKLVMAAVTIMGLTGSGGWMDIIVNGARGIQLVAAVITGGETYVAVVTNVVVVV